MSLFNHLRDTFRRRGPDRPETRVAHEDLGMKTLRHVYYQYTYMEHHLEKERQLYKMLPLFCKNCIKLAPHELATKFPEVYDFAENVAFLFVRHVTQLVQNANTTAAGVALLKYFEAGDADDASTSETGLLILKAIHILSNGPERLISAMMSSNLTAILVRCIHLFLDLPPPLLSSQDKERSKEGESPTSASGLYNPEAEEEPERGSEMEQRMILKKLIVSVLNRLLRNLPAVDNLLRFGDLSLLFGAVSCPCPQYNKVWRKAAADCLITICRRSLSADVISFIHSKGCIGFCMRNIKLAVDQPPLELVEILATIFCCLKDSSDFSQVLLDDYSACGGYKFLYDYLLHLEMKDSEDAKEAQRNLVLLISNIVQAGFLTLEPTLSDESPFQDPEFSVPIPQGDNSVRNCDAFLVLQDAFLHSITSHLGKVILDTILNIYRSDTANYFILVSHVPHTLPLFLEAMPKKNDDVQGHVFLLLEYVMMELGYVPTPELTSIGLLLQQREHPTSLTLCLNFLLKLISFGPQFKDVFREVGILTMLITSLKSYTGELAETRPERGLVRSPSGLSSPSLPLEDVQGAWEETLFLLMEALRATIEGNIQNGQLFRELGGMRCVLKMVNYQKPRRMALRLTTQLMLLDDGSVDFNALLDQLNSSAQTAVVVKIEILQTVLRVFQLDSGKKAVFREVCGFHYLISVLASLIGSLAPRRSSPWIGVPRCDILQLVHLVFQVMASAMQDDPANRNFFETNIRFDSFTAPLLLLGCFVKDYKAFSNTPSQHPDLRSSSSYTFFDSEFKTWSPPGESLSDDSFVYSAAEIFRFLRDMALDVPLAQSKSLLQVQHKEKNVNGSPMVTALRHLPSPHLVHPGAVVCMVDLLPAVDLDPAYSSVVNELEVPTEEEVENVNLSISSRDSTGNDVGESVLEDVGLGWSEGGENMRIVEECSPQKDEEASQEESGSEEMNGFQTPEISAVNNGGLNLGDNSNPEIGLGTVWEKCNEVEMAGSGDLVGEGEEEKGERERREPTPIEDDYCRMVAEEAKKWCVFLQERVVAAIYAIAMSERNQQALCQVGLPQCMLQCCNMVLSDETHPLHQSMERTFERLSYQALTPSDFRNFLRLGDPLNCSLNDITIEELEREERQDGREKEEERGEPEDGGNDGTTEEEGELPVSGDAKEGEGEVGEVTNENVEFEPKLTSQETEAESESEPESKLTNQEAESESKPALKSTNQNAPYGGSLSLARIQSLVSMTTPRDGFQPGMIGNPSFVEFDLSIDGFGCLFLPSVFPQNIDQSGPNAPASTTGIGGGGERPFPPNTGLAFSTWIFMSRCPLDDPHPLPLFTLSHNLVTTDRQPRSIASFRLHLNTAEQLLIVTTHLSRDRRNSLFEDLALKLDPNDNIEELSFCCPALFQLQSWHHVAVVVSKVRGKAKVTLFVDSYSIGTAKMSYVQPLHISDFTHFLPYPSESSPFLINAHVGSHVSQRHVCQMAYRLGPTFLFDEPITPQAVHSMYKLGPSYFGSFQAPILDDRLSTSLTPGARGDPLNPLVPEDRIVFGLFASHPINKTLHELGKTYSTVDITTIARELSLKEDDDVTPVSLLHNTAFHLFGPSRTMGAIICGYTGIRAFEPQPLRGLLSSVGGTSVVLGLVAMATTVDSLYASMKAMVCIVGNNQFALKEMERTGGFQVLGMLLRSKAHLVNSNILHLTYTLVGTVNSEHESACIPNPIAFRDLLADLSVWRATSEDIQRSLFHHFYDLIAHSSDRLANAQHMLGMKLVSVLLFRLHDNRLSRQTIKAICNVLSALLGSKPTQEDIRRVGQLLAITLPTSGTINENTISLYDGTAFPKQPPNKDGFHDNHEQEEATEHAPRGRHRRPDVLDKLRRAIMLRNMLLDILMSLLTTDKLELNTLFAYHLYHALGFDWLMLFLQAELHTETVVRALRMLVYLLCEPALMQKFHDGEIFGGWVHGFETISIEMTKLLNESPNFSPLRSSMQNPLPGAAVLSQLLPNHIHSSQVFLLMIAILLGRSGSDIPFSANFDLECFDSVFHISSMLQMGRQMTLCPDAVYVLLAMTRAMLHREHPDPTAQNFALVLVKFLERLYKVLPQFASLAATQEFVEALAATLFPPMHHVMNKVFMADADDTMDSEFVVVPSPETASISSQQMQQMEKQAIIQQHNNLTVCCIIKLLRKIVIDGFSSTQLSPREVAYCPILETVLAATPVNTSLELQNLYQTMILHSAMEYLQGTSDDILVLFRSMNASAFTRAISGMSVFCARLVDKLWQGVYSKPSSGVYTFLLALVEQARKQPNTLPLGDIQRSLNRAILYQVSAVPSTDSEQKSLMDTLCQFSSQAHTIFDDTNYDTEFLECLVYRLLQIAFTDNTMQGSQESLDMKPRQFPGYVHVASLSMMKSGANRLWSKMLEYKREPLEQILSTELPAPKNTAALVSTLDRMGVGVSMGAVPIVPSVLTANPAYIRLQNCRDLMTDQLAKAWEVYVTGEQALPQIDTVLGSRSSSLPRKSFFKPRKRDRERSRSSNLESVAHEYVDTLYPLLVLASQKYEELLMRKHQRNIDYRLRFTASEWARIEHELTRERGLWGPERPSQLDKWMLDSVEGPSRMRKRVCHNHLFYFHYPYNPRRESVAKTKYQHPISHDGKLHFKRAKLFQRSSLLSTPFPLPSIVHGNLAHLHGNDPLMNVSIEYPEGSATCLDSPLSPSQPFLRSDPLNQPDTDDPVAQALYKMIEPEDKITSQFQCARLTGLDSRDGILLLGLTHFYVIEGVTITMHGEFIDIESAPLGSYEPVVPSHLHYSTVRREGVPVPIGCIKWPYDTIREVHKRRYLLRHCALEVFSSDGRNHLLIFHQLERDRIYQKLLSLAKSSLTESQFVAGTHPETNPEQAPGLFSALLTGEKSLPERWANGEISNFQYLMHLNTLAGRSYNDLMQYPIFPWVLSDYTSETLDLTNPKSFRDFSKPMGAQTPARLSRFIERYKYFEDPTGENTPPYYYGTHYSSAMIVASYLIRMEPFTRHFLKLQGGHFDLPDRLFHSIPDSWRSVSETNMADVKELIPEFFYLPEFLTNKNRFDLGTKQSGEVLGDIILPPWAKGDPHEFIRMHREALECDYVSAHLHEWIDLIFGYKQQGEEALRAHNVFHFLFYEGSVDIDKIEDSVKRNAAISFIHNFGQMPRQIFKKPHRSRKVFTLSSNPAVDLPSVPPTYLLDSRRVFYKNLVQLMPSREPVREIRGEVGQIVYVGEKHLAAVERNKVLLPPNFIRYFMWGFPDRSARIALVEGERVTTVFEGLHQGRILCAAVAEGDLLLTGGDSTVVCVWEMKHTGIREKSRTQLNLKHTLHGHTGPVTCLAASSSYNLIVSGSKDQTCILWDINKFVFIRQLCGHNAGVTMVTINQMSGKIVSCTKNHICLWTVNGSLLAEVNLVLTGSTRLLCCAVSELFEWDKDNVIITGSSDGIVRMWCLEYQREGEKLQQKPTRNLGYFKESSSLDHPFRIRAATVVKKLQQTLKSSPSPVRKRRAESVSASMTSRGRSDSERSEASTKNDSSDEYVDSSDHFVDSTEQTGKPDTQVSMDKSKSESELDKLVQEAASVQSATSGRSEGSDEGRAHEEIHAQVNRGIAGRTESDLSQVLQTAEAEASSASEQEENEESPDSKPQELENSITQTPEVSDQKEPDSTDQSSQDEHEESNDLEQEAADGATTEQVEDSPTGDTNSTAQDQLETSAAQLKAIGAYEQLMAESRRRAEELKRKTGKWNRKLTLVHTLTMHTSYNRKDNDSPSAVTSVCVSKDHRRLFVGDTRGRIFSWTVSDNIGGVMEHWLKDEAVDSCMRCGVEFTFTERKHHCRDCGKIFCAKCSAFEHDIERLRITKKVRVCVDCFEKLVLVKASRS